MTKNEDIKTAISAIDWLEMKAQKRGFHSKEEMTHFDFINDEYINSINLEIYRIMNISPVSMLVTKNSIQITRPNNFQKIIDELNIERDRYIKEKYNV